MACFDRTENVSDVLFIFRLGQWFLIQFFVEGGKVFIHPGESDCATLVRMRKREEDGTA